MTRLLLSILTIGLLIGSAPVVHGQGADAAGESQSQQQPPEGGKFPALDRGEEGGRLAIRAVQGTPEGPAIGVAQVEVRLTHRGSLVQKLEGELDEHGVVIFEDFPIEMGVQPVVQIHYGGVTYQQVAPMMSPANPQQQVDVVCYETTYDPQPWRVQMRHVMISHAPGGVRVTEVIVVENQGEKTWLGVPRQSGKLESVVFAVPDNATDVSLGKGFHGWCCTTHERGRLASHMPLMPERTELNFSYSVPATRGSANVDVIAPTSVDHMMVIVPDDISVEHDETLELGGTDTISDTRIRYYMASNLKAGQSSELVLTGLSSVATTAASAGADSGTISKVIAGVGVVVIILIAGVIILTKSAGKPEVAKAG